MDQRQRHAGVTHVKEAALPFDQVPVVGVVVGRQPLDRPCHEIRDHGVQRHAFAGDQDAGLAGGAEAALHAAFPHLAVHAERGVHLADRTIGADGEAPLAGARLAIGDRVLDGRHAHVVQLAARRLGDSDQVGLVPQEVVQAAGQVEAFFQRVHQHLLPGLADHAAAVRDADHHGLGTRGLGLGQGHVGQAHVGLTAFHAELADGVFGPPVLDPLRHLRGQTIGRVAQEQKIGGLDHGQAPLGCARDLNGQGHEVVPEFCREASRTCKKPASGGRGAEELCVARARDGGITRSEPSGSPPTRARIPSVRRWGSGSGRPARPSGCAATWRR